jgi:hypothetical protein
MRWLLGTRTQTSRLVVLVTGEDLRRRRTWVKEQGPSGDDEYIGRIRQPIESHPVRSTGGVAGRDGLDPVSGAFRYPDFFESIGEGLAFADESGKQAQIVGPHRENLPVEVLSLHLNRSDEALQDLSHGAIELIETTEIDRHSVTAQIGSRRDRFRGQELDDRYPVVPGKSVQSRDGEAPLATLVGSEHGCLELPFGCALHVLE